MSSDTTTEPQNNTHKPRENHYHELANEYLAQAIQNCSEETQKEIAQELEKQVKGGKQC